MPRETNGGDTPPRRTSPVARNDYREGQILRARDLERESDYFLARSRQHNALAHGPGILVGLGLRGFERGTEEAVTPEELAAGGPAPLDLVITGGAAIDPLGRLIVVPKRKAVGRELATSPSTLPVGSYRLELLYARSGAGGASGADAQSPCGPGGGNGDGHGLIREGYDLRLVEHDFRAGPPEEAVGAVLDGPVDEPSLDHPVVLGVVEWDGQDYVGYSSTGRHYAPVTAQRIRSADGRTRVELRDPLGRFAVRMASLPEPDDPEPFEPEPFEDRLILDEKGDVWVGGALSVGPDGVGFRLSGTSTTRSDWRMEYRESDPGAPFRKKKIPTPQDQPEDVLLGADEYVAGARELRIQIQREGSADAGSGQHRVVVGLRNPDGTVDPALVVYDQVPTDSGRGFGVVEVLGDLYVRGTSFLHSASKLPETGDTNEQLDFILRQLAGPVAGIFRAFLTSDPDWLAEFGEVMAQEITGTQTIRDQFVAALLAEPSFVDAVVDEAVDQAVSQAVPQAVADAVGAIKQTANVQDLLDRAAEVLDAPKLGSPDLPQDTGAALLAALYRRLMRASNVRSDVEGAAHTTPGANEGAAVAEALAWLDELQNP